MTQTPRGDRIAIRFDRPAGAGDGGESRAPDPGAPALAGDPLEHQVPARADLDLTGGEPLDSASGGHVNLTGTTLSVDVMAWRAGRVDFYAIDAAADAMGERGLVPSGVAGEPGARFELLTRCQRWLGRRNPASLEPWFDRALTVHRQLHDCSRPLPRADHNHALDSWQWLLRLDAEAGAALQLAVLFHDVERLTSEADHRHEHLAPSYGEFKRHHAVQSARRMAEALAGIAAPTDAVARAAELIAAGDRPQAAWETGDGELALLEDADALSFLSLNSPGFLDYYGPAHTSCKIDWTLRRLSPRACAYMVNVRLRADVVRLLDAAIARPMDQHP